MNTLEAALPFDSMFRLYPRPMDANTVCLRIFFVAFLFVCGTITAFAFGRMAVLPFAVSWMSTEVTDASVADPFVWVEDPLSEGRLYVTKISYAGITSTLTSKTPVSEVIPTDEAIRRDFLAPPKKAVEPEPTIKVRYVKQCPSLVVRDLPQASFWAYCGDTWNAKKFISFSIPLALEIAVAILFFRHLRRYRRRIEGKR